MTWRDWLLFVHITGAVLYVGSSITLTAVVQRARRDGSLDVLLSTIEATAPLPMAGAILLLLSGAGLVITVDAWAFTSWFVLIGIGAIVISGTSESIYFSRQVRLLRPLRGRPDAMPEVGRRLSRLFRAALAIDLVPLVAIWAMVAKPGA